VFGNGAFGPTNAGEGLDTRLLETFGVDI